MRILAIGDLHGDMDRALRLVRQHAPDVLLSPGDWGDAGEVAIETWQDLLHSVPVYTVYGNHDDLDLLAGLRNRDGSPILIPNGGVAHISEHAATGLNGIWAKSHRLPYYITDEDVDASVASVSVPVEILLTHGCPLGVADLTPANRHGGQRCFLQAFQALKPRIHICGHLHRKQHHETKDGALILNPGDGRRGDHYLLDWRGRVSVV